LPPIPRLIRKGLFGGSQHVKYALDLLFSDDIAQTGAIDAFNRHQ
jgi:hypothetical protein